HRGRRGPSVAPPAREAQPPGILLAHRSRTAAGLTGKISHMQGTCTLGAAALPGLGGELGVNPAEQAEKGGIVQNAGVHCWSLLGVVTRDSPEGLLRIKSPDGDPVPCSPYPPLRASSKSFWHRPAAGPDGTAVSRPCEREMI